MDDKDKYKHVLRKLGSDDRTWGRLDGWMRRERKEVRDSHEPPKLPSTISALCSFPIHFFLPSTTTHVSPQNFFSRCLFLRCFLNIPFHQGRAPPSPLLVELICSAFRPKHSLVHFIANPAPVVLASPLRSTYTLTEGRKLPHPVLTAVS